jgi:RNA polymerase sigma factor (sigma-70 family)
METRLRCVEEGMALVSAAEIEAVYRSRYPRLLATAAAIVGHRDGARDAVQEGFARALQGRAGFRGGSLEGWIWRIVVNQARDARRRTADAPLDDAASIGFLDRERDPALVAALRQLTPRRRQIVFLRYFADLTIDEIAGVCDLSPGTVAATLSQTRALLRDVLNTGATCP